MKNKGKKLICGLMMDEMHIKENVTYKGNRLIGYINYGTGTDNCDGLPKATQVLVFMLVAINSQWKIPVGYFLINGIASSEKANLVHLCLNHVSKTGVLIKTLTFDGTAANFSMAQGLGASLSLPNLKPFFHNPETGMLIHILLDAAHMLKLCRNTLGDWKELYNDKMEPIKWSFFENLVGVQDEIGLHLGTKIRSRHVKYSKEKMKVFLAAQTFSRSVADALTFCAENLNLNSFKNIEPTIEFCNNMNNIFDFLNTRNFLSKSLYKKPLKKKDEDFINDFINSSIDYLKSLQCKNADGKKVIPVIKSTRKTGFIGFIISLMSIGNIFNDLLKTDKLEFLLTYKLSQDHLEMFFSAVRHKGGFNNNPTALQFESAYKRLLVHSEIMVSSGANCLALDFTKILTVSSSRKKIKNSENIYLDMLHAEVNEEDFITSLTVTKYNLEQLKTVIDGIIEYIAGFIVHKLEKKILCDKCISVLTRTHSEPNSLLNTKNRGRLTKPSIDVISISKVAERIFKMYGNKLSSEKNILLFLILKSTSNLNINNLFINISDHFLNQDPLNNHLLQLTHLILKSYFIIRIHHYTKIESQPKEHIRSFLTKTIHFKNQ